MNINIRQRLAGKSAYIALAILLISILVFTVIAIVATVNSSNEPTIPPVDDDTPAGGDVTPSPDDPAGDDTQSGSGSVETPDDTPSVSEPEKPVYALPCSGSVQKDYSDDTLVFSSTMNDYRIHMGIDISGNLGDPVKAFGKGKISRIYTDPFMGKTVVIDHGSGLKSVYMNLDATLPEGIKEGVQVDCGTVIGAIGETAMNECADSPHLHFEVMLENKRVDPKNYVTLPSSADSDNNYEG